MKSEETKVIKPEYYVSTSEIPRGTAGYGGGGSRGEAVYMYITFTVVSTNAFVN